MRPILAQLRLAIRPLEQDPLIQKRHLALFVWCRIAGAKNRFPLFRAMLNLLGVASLVRKTGSHFFARCSICWVSHRCCEKPVPTFSRDALTIQARQKYARTF
jgi:hypothetical protein